MKKFVRGITRIWLDRSGNFAVAFAVAAVPLVGVVGLAVDYSKVSNQEWNLQEALDGAVLAAAGIKDASKKERKKLGQEYFKSNTQNPCNNDATLKVKNNQKKVVGTAACEIDTSFLGVVGYPSVSIKARAVAIWSEEQSSNGCIYALDSGNTSESISLNSMDYADFKDCVPVANSTHAEAIKLSSINTYKGGGLYSAGGVTVASVGSFQVSEAPQKNMPPLPDPYAHLSDASDGVSCTNTGSKSGNTYSPGTFCGGLDIGGNAVFNPGTYYIVNGDFKISSANSVSCNCSAAGSGVTFVITGTQPGNTGKVEVASTDNFTLRAPSDASYDYPGILFYVDRDAPSEEFKFSSIVNMAANGVIYAPSQRMTFDSIGAGSTECSQIVGHNVKFGTMEGFGRTDNCASYGITQLGSGGGGNQIRLTH